MGMQQLLQFIIFIYIYCYTHSVSKNDSTNISQLQAIYTLYIVGNILPL